MHPKGGFCGFDGTSGHFWSKRVGRGCFHEPLFCTIDRPDHHLSASPARESRNGGHDPDKPSLDSTSFRSGKSYPFRLHNASAACKQKLDYFDTTGTRRLQRAGGDSRRADFPKTLGGRCTYYGDGDQIRVPKARGSSCYQPLQTLLRDNNSC